MRILVINQYAGSPSHGMEFRPHWLAREWLAKGHDVLIVAGTYSHLRHRNFRSSYQRPALIDGVPFIFLWVPKYSGNGPLRLIGIFLFGLQLRLISSKLIKWRPTAVVASSTHPFDVRPGNRIARAANARFVFEVHDLWPQTPMHVGGMSARHPVIALMQRNEDFACSHADAVVSILPKTEPYLQSRGLPPGKWFFVPNGADLTLDLTEEERNSADEITRAARKDGRFLIGYLGGFALSNALDQLLQSMEMLADKSIRLLLVGDGDEKTKLQSGYSNLPNLTWQPRVNPRVARAIMERCDALYFGVLDSPLYALSGLGLNKFADYCAAGRPIIEACPIEHSLTHKLKNGVWSAAENPARLVSAIQELAGLETGALDIMGDAGRQWAHKNLSREVLAQRFLDAIG